MWDATASMWAIKVSTWIVAGTMQAVVGAMLVIMTFKWNVAPIRIGVSNRAHLCLTRNDLPFPVLPYELMLVVTFVFRACLFAQHFVELSISYT